MGLDYASAGDPRKAIPWLARAHEWAPTRTDIAYALSEQLIQLQYFDSAKEVLRQTLTQNPRDVLLAVALGDEKLAEGDSPGALDTYNQALAASPQMPSALIGCARAYIAQGKDEKAQAFLEKALLADPGNPAALGGLGVLEAQHEQWSLAFDHLNRAWSQDRSNTNVALQLARTLQHVDRAADAVQLLVSLPPSAQTSPAFHMQLAQLYAGLGRTSEAESERAAVEKLRSQNGESIHFDNPKTYVY